MKGFVASAALAASPLRALGGIELNLDWDEAIKENNLREEVSRLMKKNNVFVEYFSDSDASLRSMGYERIKGADIPVKELYKIKKHIEEHEDFYERHKVAGITFPYISERS